MRLGSPLQTAADTKTRGCIIPKLPRMETNTDDQKAPRRVRKNSKSLGTRGVG